MNHMNGHCLITDSFSLWLYASAIDSHVVCDNYEWSFCHIRYTYIMDRLQIGLAARNIVF